MNRDSFFNIRIVRLLTVVALSVMILLTVSACGDSSDKDSELNYDSPETVGNAENGDKENDSETTSEPDDAENPEPVYETIECDDGSIYEGYTVNGKFEGYGVMTYADVDESTLVNYSGEWKDGVKDGFGTMLWKNGAVYEGEWKNDKRNGNGKHTFSNGDVYEGDWVDGNRTGEGTMTYSADDEYDRLSYVGGWNDGTREGYGVLTWTTGAVYDGEWKDDTFNGYGKHVYVSGEVYEGEWKDGDWYGTGTLTWPDGSSYSGGFIGQRKNGEGVMTYADGTTEKENWVNGVNLYDTSSSD